MARTGVTYADIAKAAEAIKSRGGEPTVDRVREHLGSGSKSTIAPLLKRWRSENGDTADVGGLPNDLLEVVKSLHERVQQMADHKIDQARERFKSRSEEFQKELAEAHHTIAQLTERQQDLERQIGQLTSQRETLDTSLEEIRIKLARTESQRDEAATRAAEQRAAVAELKRENRDIRDHFEHYQQRTAEDRQQQREQFENTNRQFEETNRQFEETHRQLQNQNQALNSQLVQQTQRVAELLADNKRLQSTINELGENIQSLKLENGKHVAAIDYLNQELEAAQAKSEESFNQREALRNRIVELEGQQAAMARETTFLSLTREKLETELAAAKNKITLLSDENKVILQEKAILQGQFKQLQDTR